MCKEADPRSRKLAPGNLIIGHSATGAAVLNIGTTASGAVFTTGTGAMTVNKTGVVTIGSGANTGSLNANGNITIDGGTLTRGSGSGFNLASGKTMTIQNGGSASFTNGYTTAAATYNIAGMASTLTSASGVLSISNGGQLHVSSGGKLSSGGNFVIGNGGNGTLTVDGDNSSLDSTGATNTWGRIGNAATVTFSHNATGTLSGILNLAENSAAGTTAMVDVLSGADVSVGGDITLTSSGGAAYISHAERAR